MSTEKDKTNIQDKAISSAPKWVFSISGVFLVLAISLKIIGIDPSPPLNRIMDAYALEIELKAKSEYSIPDERINALEEAHGVLSERIRGLEQYSHKPR